MSTEVAELMHAEFDKVRFDLWCEEEWKECRRDHYFYEPDLLYAFLHFIRPGDVCIDAGANIGYHTIFMSQLVGPTGLVLAFEPDPIHFSKLEANIKLNGLTNIQIFKNGLWEEQGQMDFWSVKGGGYSSFARFINMAPEKIRVQVVKLDDIINLDRRVRMIKIDCEGAEQHILHGGKEMLSKTDCVIAEFNFSIMGAFGASDRSIRDYMKEQGFDFFILRKDGTEPVYVPDDIKIKVKGRKPHMFNGIFVKPGIYEIKTATA